MVAVFSQKMLRVLDWENEKRKKWLKALISSRRLVSRRESQGGVTSRRVAGEGMLAEGMAKVRSSLEKMDLRRMCVLVAWMSQFSKLFCLADWDSEDIVA